jgi:hypothetical protein
VAIAEDGHVEDPIGRALTVTVYAFASAVLVVRVNKILAVFEAGKDIRLAGELTGEYVTWYSIEADPQ